MEATALIRSTLQALTEAEVPSELLPVAFAKVFDQLANSHEANASASRSAGQPLKDVLSQDRPALIASRLAVPIEVIEQAYFLEGESFELTIPPSRFDVAKSRATEQIALLVAAGRQAAGLDEDGWTSVDPIRQMCENFKRFDSSNFATTIRDMDEVFTVRGAGRDRKVRMTAPAWQRARELLLELVGRS